MLVCACVMTWMGWSSSPMEALALCLSRRNLPESVMCPSQMRYLQYFDNLLQNVRPSADALQLTSVTVAHLPDVENGACSPFLEVGARAAWHVDLQPEQTRLRQLHQGERVEGRGRAGQRGRVGRVRAQRRAARERLHASPPPRGQPVDQHRVPRPVLHGLREAVQAGLRGERLGHRQSAGRRHGGLHIRTRRADRSGGRRLRGPDHEGVLGSVERGAEAEGGPDDQHASVGRLCCRDVSLLEAPLRGRQEVRRWLQSRLCE